MIKIDVYLDLSNLNCPLPILKTKQALQKMQEDQVLQVIATDPHSEIDFKAFLSRSSHELCGFEISEGHYVFTIRKGKT